MRLIFRHVTQTVFLLCVFVTLGFSEERITYSTTVDSLPQKVIKTKQILPPREHRGFYYGFGVGVNYSFLYNQIVSRDENGILEEQESDRYSGLSFPAMEFKFGRSFGNVIALYTLLSMSVPFGELHYKYEETDDDDEIYNDDGFGFIGFIGFGLTVYPFMDKNSVMNGFFVGQACGVGAMAGMTEERDFHTQGLLLNHIEIGKDWWISDSWSLGVGLGYTFYVGKTYDEEKTNLHSVQIMFRLTRG